MVYYCELSAVSVGINFIVVIKQGYGSFILGSFPGLGMRVMIPCFIVVGRKKVPKMPMEVTC